MRVRVLGSFDVDGLADRDLRRRKGRTLLKVLTKRNLVSIFDDPNGQTVVTG